MEEISLPQRTKSVIEKILERSDSPHSQSLFLSFLSKSLCHRKSQIKFIPDSLFCNVLQFLPFVNVLKVLYFIYPTPVRKKEIEKKPQVEESKHQKKGSGKNARKRRRKQKKKQKSQLEEETSHSYNQLSEFIRNCLEIQHTKMVKYLLTSGKYPQYSANISREVLRWLVSKGHSHLSYFLVTFCGLNVLRGLMDVVNFELEKNELRWTSDLEGIVKKIFPVEEGHDAKPDSSQILNYLCCTLCYPNISKYVMLKNEEIVVDAISNVKDRSIVLSVFSQRGFTLLLPNEVLSQLLVSHEISSVELFGIIKTFDVNPLVIRHFFEKVWRKKKKDPVKVNELKKFLEESLILKEQRLDLLNVFLEYKVAWPWVSQINSKIENLGKQLLFKMEQQEMVCGICQKKLKHGQKNIVTCQTCLQMTYFCGKVCKKDCETKFHSAKLCKKLEAKNAPIKMMRKMKKIMKRVDDVKLDSSKVTKRLENKNKMKKRKGKGKGKKR